MDCNGTQEQQMLTTTQSNGCNGGNTDDLMSTSTSSSTNGSTGGGNGGNNTNGCAKKVSITTPDPTLYVTKARVTRPTPPPPSYNPMQFVQIKPCNLYQTAQEQLKKAEEVKKLKEVKKEEPEEWQNNLDNWKSSRRKRVEHIIDRAVETKKLELEEHERQRRKSKTFSEMIEERAERSGPRGRVKLASLAVYNEDEANDFSDLGIGTSSASGKSSLSEDYDNNSVMSDNAAELDKAIGAAQHHKHNNGTAALLKSQQQQQHHHSDQQHAAINHQTTGRSNSTTREYISSPGYDTSSSTAPASSPDPCEYTYEGAIQDYKARVTRAASGGKLPTLDNNNKSKDNSPTTQQLYNTTETTAYPTRRGSKIEDRLIGFEVTSPSDNQEGIEKQKVDVPKIDISKRKEIFENQAAAAAAAAANESKVTTPTGTMPTTNGSGVGGGNVVPKVVLRERFKFESASSNNANANDLPAAKKEVKRLSGDISSIRDRMQSLEQQRNLVNATKTVDVPVPPLKERLSSLQNAVTKEDVKKPPVALVDARQLEIMKNEEERMKQLQRQEESVVAPTMQTKTTAVKQIEVIVETVPETANDSGIHNSSDDIELQLQEQQLNDAIAALALEEKQLEEAANAVNLIEAEFAELTDLNPAPLVKAPPVPTATVSPAAASTATKTATAAAPAAIVAPAAAATTTTNEPTRNMEFSVSSTNNFIIYNPENPTSSTCSPVVGSNNKNVNDNNVVASTSDGVSVATVLGNTTATTTATSNLRRKPSNEMVHARNLLKMFKETFNNDIQLDEEQENQVDVEISETVAKKIVPTQQSNETIIKKVESPENQIADIHKNIEPSFISVTTPPVVTQIFDFTGVKSSTPPVSNLTQKPPSPLPTPRTPSTPPTPTAAGSSMIPRAIIGKPPMSPKAVRYAASPINSPTPQRKAAENQFSINGRVEIFNSKQLEAAAKPPTPTMNTKKTHMLAQIPITKTEIGLQEVGETTAVSAVPLGKSMPAATAANEANIEIRAATTKMAPSYLLQQQQQQQQQQQSPQPATEVVICAPPVTIVNPDELPKPNTVKALSSCFSKDVTPPIPPPKPLPRSRIPQITPPQSPTPAKRSLPTSPIQNKSKDVVDRAFKTAAPIASINLNIDEDDINAKKHSIISTSSNNSADYAPISVQTSAVVHTPPNEQSAAKIADPLAPNDCIKAVVTQPSNMPQLVVCTPNESSLFKLVSSAPHSPASPRGALEADIALCTSFLESQAPKDLKLTHEDLEYQRQHTIEELPCDKIDVRTRPANDQVPCTGYQDISDEFIKHCDGINAEKQSTAASPTEFDIALCESFLNSMTPKDLKPQTTPFPAVRQQTIEEIPCDKIDVHKLPPPNNLPATGFQEITAADIKRCDNLLQGATKTATTTTKPNSPIMAARAAHSKALIDTCEKIIAEERLASSQMKSTLPISPKSTPLMQRKSKIPKPIPCCISGSDSMNRADYEPVAIAAKDKDADDNVLIARTHVVETQIKVTTTDPPPTTPPPTTTTATTSKPITSPKPAPKEKKTKNIFDFLRRNFGHHENAAAADTNASDSIGPAQEVVATNSGVDVVKVDEIHTVDNSKFYLPSDDIAPPPLPKSAAPVNIEIKKTITTDEIVEEHNNDLALSQEINELLDDELNRLTVVCSEEQQQHTGI